MAGAAANYGDLGISNRVTGRVWTEIKDLSDEKKDQTVLVSGRIQSSVLIDEEEAIFIVRSGGFYTVKCVLRMNPGDEEMVRYAVAVPKESIVDIQGIVTLPPQHIKGVSQDAGVEVYPLGDLTIETKRTLGKLVLEKYGTEFYILHRFPLAVRPFYTMPCGDNEAYSNSFDVFLGGEEIISGAQHVHVPELLESRARQCGIEVKTVSTYIDLFRDGVPHGGFNFAIERFLKQLCSINDIRKTMLFYQNIRFPI